MARVTAIPLHQESVQSLGLRDELIGLRAKTAALDTHGLLQFALKQAFPGRIGVVSSFAAESVVLLHQVVAIDPTTPVLFLNTGKLFGDTLRYRDRLQDALGLTAVSYTHL